MLQCYNTVYQNSSLSEKKKKKKLRLKTTLKREYNQRYDDSATS